MGIGARRQGQNCEFDTTVGVLLDSVEALTKKILEQVWGTPGYDDEHMTPQDLATRIAPNLRSVIASLSDGKPLPRAALATAEQIGRSRALQGVPVDALAYSWSTAERALLDKLLSYADVLSAQELRAVVRRLGQAIDALSRRSIGAYRDTQQAVTAHYDHLATDLVARIAGGFSVEADEVERRAREIGADPQLPYVAVAVVATTGGAAAQVRVQRHLLAAVGAHASARILFGSLDGRALLLVPVPRGHNDALAKVLDACAHDSHRPDPVLIGISEHTATLHQAGPACRQARLAIEVAQRLDWTDRVVRFAEVTTEVLLLRNPDVAELIGRHIEPLRERPELLATLRVYLECGMSARAAARKLYVHPNTVPHRLRTIERLIGRPLCDVFALCDVVLALRCSALWPEEKGP